MIKLWKRRLLSGLPAVLVLVISGAASGEELPIAERPRLDLSVLLESKAAVGRAVSYLRQRQRDDGSWHQSPMLTSLALAALAQSPEAESDEVDPAIRQALSYLQAADPLDTDSEPEPEAGHVEDAQDGEDAPKDAANGLSRQAETVLRIMTAVSGEQDSRLSDLATRTLPAGHPPAGLEAAVVTAVRLRECLVPEAESRANLQSALQWACTYYAGPTRQGLDKRECRTFIYVLGRALRAVRAELPDSGESGENWRRGIALELLNQQRGKGEWTCGNRQDGEADVGSRATTASTAFALLLFGQVLNP